MLSFRTQAGATVLPGTLFVVFAWLPFLRMPLDEAQISFAGLMLACGAVCFSAGLPRKQRVVLDQDNHRRWSVGGTPLDPKQGIVVEGLAAPGAQLRAYLGTATGRHCVLAGENRTRTLGLVGKLAQELALPVHVADRDQAPPPCSGKSQDTPPQPKIRAEADALDIVASDGQRGARNGMVAAAVLLSTLIVYDVAGKASDLRAIHPLSLLLPTLLVLTVFFVACMLVTSRVRLELDKTIYVLWSRLGLTTRRREWDWEQLTSVLALSGSNVGYLIIECADECVVFESTPACVKRAKNAILGRQELATDTQKRGL